MKLTKRLASLLTALLLLCGMAVPACAHEVVDMDATGSVSVTMSYNGKAVGGGAFTVYKVGEVVEDDGNFGFVLADEFVSTGVELNQNTIESADVAQELADYANEVAATGTKVKIVSDGRATAANLSVGLYLFVQTSTAKGYAAVNPFLVSVPMCEDGVYTYDVEATPKMSTITEAAEESSGSASGSVVPGTSKTRESKKLPQTGQLNWPMPVLAMVGMSLILVGWVLKTEKKTRYAK